MCALRAHGGKHRIIAHEVSDIIPPRCGQDFVAESEVAVSLSVNWINRMIFNMINKRITQPTVAQYKTIMLYQSQQTYVIIQSQSTLNIFTRWFFYAENRR